MIRIGILTSSRADYGIYLPLLISLENDKDFDLKLIVFGTHLSKFHGYTLTQIEKDGFAICKKIESILIGDSPNAISSSYGLTAQKFAEYWEQDYLNFDVVFALGDRFEMAAAVVASIPYGINIAHLHGGETTLGAIDNIYRHSISLASKLHFVSTEIFADRLKLLLNDESAIIANIGSLSLENLNNLKLLSIDEFNEKWKIDLQIPTLLVTVHPETVDFENNKRYCQEITNALEVLREEFHIVITMPNADTSGIVYRESFSKLANLYNNITIIENFGTQSYFTCMKHAKILIGNTSSGIIEAASFNKYVLNLGDRQKGRLCSANVSHIPFDAQLIVKKTRELAFEEFIGENIYFKESPSKSIIKSLKNQFVEQ